MKPSTEPSSGNGSPSAAGEDALTLARDNRERARALLHKCATDGSPLLDIFTAELGAAYARGRAAGPVMDEAVVERMARAACENYGNEWAETTEDGTGMRAGDCVLPDKRDWREIVRAAIAAIPAPPAPGLPINEQARAVLQAACWWSTAHTMVTPGVSRQDAEAGADKRLYDAVSRYQGTFPASAAPPAGEPPHDR